MSEVKQSNVHVAALLCSKDRHPYLQFPPPYISHQHLFVRLERQIPKLIVAWQSCKPSQDQYPADLYNLLLFGKMLTVQSWCIMNTCV